MPTDMNKYPTNWGEIRNEILLRAGGSIDDPRVGAKCEWCQVENYAVGFRDEDRQFIDNEESYQHKEAYSRNTSYAEAVSEKKYFDGESNRKYVVIVLTIAHLKDPDPMNCARSNLAALCQKCHNTYDMPMRTRNRQATRRQATIDAGQMELI